MEQHYGRAAELYAEEGRPTASAEAAARGAKALEEQRPEVGAARLLPHPACHIGWLAGVVAQAVTVPPCDCSCSQLSGGDRAVGINSRGAAPPSARQRQSQQAWKQLMAHRLTSAFPQLGTPLHPSAQASTLMYRRAVEWLEDAGKDALAGDVFRCGVCLRGA